MFYFFNNFDVIFFTWLDLIDLFFYSPHFINFDSFKNYMEIVFVKKNILIFYLVLFLKYKN
jgi:hypothetical protein